MPARSIQPQWTWLGIPVVVAVAGAVFLALDRLTARTEVVAQPVLVVNKVAKRFITPPSKSAPAKKRPTAILLPPDPIAVPPESITFPSFSWRAAGDGGALQHSMDGGITWQSIPLPEESTGRITAVHKTDDDITVETSTGQRWSTPDAGLHWRHGRP